MDQFIIKVGILLEIIDCKMMKIGGKNGDVGWFMWCDQGTYKRTWKSPIDGISALRPLRARTFNARL